MCAFLHVTLEHFNCSESFCAAASAGEKHMFVFDVRRVLNVPGFSNNTNNNNHHFIHRIGDMNRYIHTI